MILGFFDLTTYTMLHVVISLIAIIAGFVVMTGMLGSAADAEGCTALFLTLTVLTSLTGFGFPFTDVLPSHVVGVISLVVLLFAILAYYQYRLAGAWRWIYVVTALRGALVQRVRPDRAGASRRFRSSTRLPRPSRSRRSWSRRASC